MKALRIVGYICLFLATIYTMVFSDSKKFDGFVFACWAAVIFYWWIEERDAKEKRFYELVGRVHHLERQVGKLQRDMARGD